MKKACILLFLVVSSLVIGFKVWANLPATLTSGDLPFYKADSGTTQRTPASVARSLSPTALDSRTVQTASSPAVTFDSSGALWFSVIVR